MTRAPLYCAFWCEENLWHLCEHEAVVGRERYVLIISNLDQQIAMWSQRSAARAGQPIGWDYHVALLVRGDASSQVWDLDSTLGAPAPATTWLARSFLELPPAARAFAPMFRVVPTDDYRRQFSSDRSHMRDKAGGYHHPVPSWPAIVQGPNNLDRFIDMNDRFVGEIMDLAELREWLLPVQAP
jgi:hypothetical protein